MSATDRTSGEIRGLQNAIRALVRRFSLTERADVACCGMTVAQAATLQALGVDGPMRMTDLGRRLGIAPSTLTRNLRRLEERGLVERSEDPEDARAFVIGLTRAGRAGAARVERQDEEFAESVLEAIDPERREVVLDSLAELLRAIRSASERCCPGAYDHLWSEIEPGLRERTEGCSPEGARGVER